MIRLAGLSLPVLYFLYGKGPAVIFSVTATASLLAVESLRFACKPVNDFILRNFFTLLKEKEKSSLTGVTYFAIGSLMALVFYEKEAAMAAIIYSVFGDIASTLVGYRWGRVRIVEEKTLEGSAACFAVCLAAGFLMHVSGFHLGIFKIILGAVAATLSELLSRPVDDNVSIPVVSGFVIQFA